jgi:hypothetical protein
MKKTILMTIILLVSFAGFVFAGNGNENPEAPAKVTLQGRVIDQSTQEELAGVTILVEGTGIKAYSDIEGNFKIEGMTPGTYSLNVSYISYKDKCLKDIQVSASESLDIAIQQVD